VYKYFYFLEKKPKSLYKKKKVIEYIYYVFSISLKKNIEKMKCLKNKFFQQNPI